MAVGTWIQIQTECEKRTGQAGHRDEEVQNVDIRQRMFLARTRRMQQVRNAEKQYGFLAKQDRKESN